VCVCVRTEYMGSIRMYDARDLNLRARNDERK